MLKLVNGDCVEMMRELPNNSVNFVLADMPYGTTNCKWDTELDLALVWAQIKRICFGPVALFAQAPFDKSLAMSNIDDFRYEWIWEKSHATGHLNAKKCPMKSHENILIFYERHTTYNPIKTTGHTRKVSTKRGDVSEIYGNQTIKELSYDSTERYPRSVLKFSSDKQKVKLHPTQKPVALCEYLIRTYTNEGDVVLDFTMGSGTTGVAAKNLKRSFIGMEIEQKYYATACRRIGVMPC